MKGTTLEKCKNCRRRCKKRLKPEMTFEEEMRILLSLDNCNIRLPKQTLKKRAKIYDFENPEPRFLKTYDYTMKDRRIL